MHGDAEGAPQAPVRVERGFHLTAAVIFALFAVTLVAQLPSGLVPGWLAAQRDSYRVLWPQGWSFFANAPEAEVLVAYHVEPDGRLTRATRREMSEQSLLGARRVTAAQVVETRQIASLIPDRYWSVCAASGRQSCGRMEKMSRYPVVNRSRHPTLCGLMAFAVEQPRPRPLSDGFRGTPRRRRIMALADVTCAR